MRSERGLEQETHSAAGAVARHGAWGWLAPSLAALALALAGCTEDPDAAAPSGEDVQNDTGGQDGTDVGDVGDGSDATDATDSADSTDTTDGVDGADAPDVPVVPDTTDVTVPPDVPDPDTAPTCPCALPAGVTDCRWCDLEAVSCTTTDECLSAAATKATAGDLPAFQNVDGSFVADFPACHQSVCDAGKCVPLQAIEECCPSAADCPAASACLAAQCQAPELDAVPAGLEGANLGYCTYTFDNTCCTSAANTTALTENGNFGFPTNWSQTQAVANGFTRWWAIPASDNDSHCRGGGCLFLGFATTDPALGGTICHTTFAPKAAGDLDPATCGKVPGVSTGNTVDTTLSSPSISLQEAAGTTQGQPWALTFWYRMNGDPSSTQGGANIGDELELWVEDGSGERRLAFTSASSSNTTGGKHIPVSVDLSRYGGQTIRLHWRFNTHDVTDTLYEGVYLDDIVVQSLCGQALCGGLQGTTCAAGAACDQIDCVAAQKTTPLLTEEPIAFCLTQTKPGCVPCSADTDCVQPGAIGECLPNGTCKFTAGTCPDQVLSETFEAVALPSEWETLNDPFCSNTWVTSTHRAASGSRSLYFGHETPCADGEPRCDGGLGTSCPTFECSKAGNPTNGTIAIPATLLPQTDLLLSFQLFLSNEYLDNPPLCGDGPGLPPCEFIEDRFRVYAVPPSGIKKQLWDNIDDKVAQTNCDFVPVTIDISEYAGQNVGFEFVFDSIGGQQNRYEGVYLDNVAINPKCSIAGQTCTKAADCTALDACDQVACEAGACTHAPKASCCGSDADCETDGNICTEDKCDLATNTCKPSVVKGAPCCDDTADYTLFDFEAGLPEGWTVETPNGIPTAVAWHWAEGDGLNGGGAARFANPATKTYEVAGSAVAGSLTTGPLALPPIEPTVAFDLWLDTEFRSYSEGDMQSYVDALAFFYQDRLRALVQEEGSSSWTQVWRSDDGEPLLGSTFEDGSVRWVRMAFSLSAYAGKTVRVRFEFDSANEQGNNYGGARLDNVAVRQVCPTASFTPCLADAWCNDADKCTDDSCSGGCVNAPIPGKVGCCFPSQVAGADFDTGALPAGWTVLNAANAATPVDAVRWHVSALQGRNSVSSLRFGDAGGETYSSCACSPTGDIAACDGGCSPAQCTTASGRPTPGGSAVSAEFPVEQGKDYALAFSLRADLSQEEVEGFIEDFRVELVWQGPSKLETVDTLVCHGADCDVYDANNKHLACESGINFTYPGCPIDGAPGDYGAWRDYSFKLSDILCAANGSIAEGLRSSIASLPAGGSLTKGLQLRVTFAATDNADNCGDGLFVDQVSWSVLCTGWAGQCQ